MQLVHLLIRYILATFPLTDRVEIHYHVYNYVGFGWFLSVRHVVHSFNHDLFFVPLSQLKKDLLGPKRFANLSYLSHVLHSRTNQYLLPLTLPVQLSGSSCDWIIYTKMFCSHKEKLPLIFAIFKLLGECFLCG